MGLEFLDVTAQVRIALIDSSSKGGGRRQRDELKITNNSSSIVDTHLLIVVQGLSDQIRLVNASGFASTGDPYLRVFLPNGVLLPGQSIVETLRFERQGHALTPPDSRPGEEGEHQHPDHEKERRAPPVSYTLKLLSGQGNP